MEGGIVKLPVKGVLSVFYGDQPQLVTQVSFAGEVEAAEIPSAATGKAVVVHGFDMSADGRPDPVNPSAWLRLVMGAEAVCNELIVCDQDLQVKLESLVKDHIAGSLQASTGQTAPAGSET